MNYLCFLTGKLGLECQKKQHIKKNYGGELDYIIIILYFSSNFSLNYTFVKALLDHSLTSLFTVN